MILESVLTKVQKLEIWKTWKPKIGKTKLLEPKIGKLKIGKAKIREPEDLGNPFATSTPCTVLDYLNPTDTLCPVHYMSLSCLRSQV